MSRSRIGLLPPLAPLLLVVGCGTQASPLLPPNQAKPEIPALGAKFDPQATGSIEGRVVWTGELPSLHGYRDARVGVGEAIDANEKKNPGLPRIIGPDNGVAGAVVFLREVEPERSKSWGLPSVSVVMRDGLIRVKQGELESSSGFVHLGDEVEMISHGSALEMLRGQGAAFFTLAFPQPEKPIRRRFERLGIVEFSSGAGNYWARSWLFVAEHPYYVRTDETGRFKLVNVPEGSYELACWMPNWNVDHFDRDPEMMNVARVAHMPAAERVISVVVKRGETVNVEFSSKTGDFPRKQ